MPAIGFFVWDYYKGTPRPPGVPSDNKGTKSDMRPFAFVGNVVGTLQTSWIGMAAGPTIVYRDKGVIIAAGTDIASTRFRRFAPQAYVRRRIHFPVFVR